MPAKQPDYFQCRYPIDLHHYLLASLTMSLNAFEALKAGETLAAIWSSCRRQYLRGEDARRATRESGAIREGEKCCPKNGSSAGCRSPPATLGGRGALTLTSGGRVGTAKRAKEAHIRLSRRLPLPSWGCGRCGPCELGPRRCQSQGTRRAFRPSQPQKWIRAWQRAPIEDNEKK